MTLEGAEGRIWCSKIGWQTVMGVRRNIGNTNACIIIIIIIPKFVLQPT